MAKNYPPNFLLCLAKWGNSNQKKIIIIRDAIVPYLEWQRSTKEPTHDWKYGKAGTLIQCEWDYRVVLSLWTSV